MNRFFSVGWGLTAALSTCTAVAAQVVGGTPSFAAVRAQIDVDEVDDADGVKVVEFKIDPSFAEVGSAQDIHAKARAAFGNNGTYAEAKDKPAYLGAYAESIWSDAFTIMGGVGAGTLDVRVSVNGTMDGAGRPGGPGSNSFYQLYVSRSPISCDFDRLSCTGTLLIPLTEGMSGSKEFSVALPFNYGETFYLASYLGAEVLGNGFSDFYGSAHFSATAPGGAALTGDSGVTYAQVSSVPEPESATLVWAGLAALGLARRKPRK